MRLFFVAALASSVCLAGDEARQEKLDQAQAQGIEFLKKAQLEDGSWTTPNAPGITALVLTSLLQSGVPANDPTVEKATAFLLALKQPDGGIYQPKSNHRNYETCIVILALTEMNQDGKYQETIDGAAKFIREQQWDEGEKIDETHPNYGGAGYGSKSRPDLSNTSFLLEALKATGASEDDEAVQKALKFVSRSQNLESESNTTPFAAKVNDGGFYYTPAAGGESFAGKEPDGGLRSYASMTYAGLKSMLYAGVSPDDPRVKAAFKWIQSHYTVDENPGMGMNGVYYYYHTFSKALYTLGEAEIVDSDGKKHDWRDELVSHLAKEQKSNGSWVNATPRWNEGDPNLATAFALISLSYCEKPFATK